MSGETMREAVARAIAKELTGGFPSSPKSIDHKAADAAIRTVLERLREPTSAILKIGTTAIADYYNDPEAEPPNTDEMRAGWRAMLDAALESLPEPADSGRG